MMSPEVNTSLGLASLLVLTPLVAAVGVVLTSRRAERLVPVVGATVSMFALLASAWMWWRTDWSDGSAARFGERVAWIPAFGLEWHLTVDGLAMGLLLAITSVCALAHLSSLTANDWPSSPERSSGLRARTALLLVVQAAASGCVVSADSLLFYTFVLLTSSAASLCCVCERGSDVRRLLVYQIGGVLIAGVGLVAIWSAAREAGATALDFEQLAGLAREGKLRGELFGADFGDWVFWTMFVGFALACAAVPVHGWWIATVGAARRLSTVAAIATAWTVSAFGLVRVMTYFGGFALPDDSAIFAISILGSVTVLYGGLLALSARSAGELAGCAWTQHLGFLLLGLATFESKGWVGAMTCLIAGGFGLMLLASCAFGRRDRFTAWIAIGAAVGAPGLCLFVPRLLVLLGAAASEVARPFAIACAFGPLLLAVAYLRVMRSVDGARERGHAELDRRWRLALSFVVVVLGLMPFLLTDLVSPRLSALLELVRGATK